MPLPTPKTPDAPDLTRQPLSLAVLLTLGGVCLGGMGLAWTGSGQIARMEAAMDRQKAEADKEHTQHGKDLDDIRAAMREAEARNGATVLEARTAGREQRESIGRRSQEMNDAQQRQIDQLRAEQNQTNQFVAEARTRMGAMENLLSRMDQRLEALPAQLLPRPAPARAIDRLPPSGWASPR